MDTATRRMTPSSLQPGHAGHPTGAAEPSTTRPRAAILSGRSRPWGRSRQPSMSAETGRGGYAHRLLRRLRDGVFHAVGPVDRRGPDPPCRVAPERGPSAAGLRGCLALLAARADEPAVLGRSGQHRAVADLVCDRRWRWRPGPGPGAGPRPNRAWRGGVWGRRGPVRPDRVGGGGARLGG